MADPATHQIQHHRTGGNTLSIEGRESGPESTIKMVHKAGFGIKERIIGAIELETLLIRQHLGRVPLRGVNPEARMP